MKLEVSVLLIICLHRVNCSLPDFTPATPLQQVDISMNSESSAVTSVMRIGVSRLPGLCRRLKRRRVTVLCNLKTFCWSGSSDRDRSGQVCRCPRGSRCSHFFIHSL
ncbi:uncharacterized protein si:ch211-191i18.4 [Anabas testudineus]|uniref:uncharacterized protein si:ch211-191i18.4 n=1 Tax=Anabas testudineus TaxID=64144 RepID=UPI00143D8DA4|nr:uncharacterized protein si:ch211-191i18.4 [Anabas testudineus]